MRMRIEIGASYPVTPKDMTPGKFAQSLFEATFPEGYKPMIDNRTPKEVAFGLRV